MYSGTGDLHAVQLADKIINLNNGYLGMVRQWQEFFYEKRYAMSYMDSLPDFVKLAEAYGHVGIQLKTGRCEQALEDAMVKYKDRLVFIDFITDREENVYPMIPAGAGLNEMILIEYEKHIISILMENEAGALSRVAGLFSARAYNIESLTVAPPMMKLCRV